MKTTIQYMMNGIRVTQCPPAIAQGSECSKPTVRMVRNMRKAYLAKARHFRKNKTLELTQ